MAAAAGSTTELEAQVQALSAAVGRTLTRERPLRVTCVGAGAWGSVFVAKLKQQYEETGLVQTTVWRRGGRVVSKEAAAQLVDIINGNERVLRRLRDSCSVLKYIEARLGDRELTADEILRDGFCLNLLDEPLCPLSVVVNLEEAVFSADVLINALPSTETRSVFSRIGKVLAASRKTPEAMPLVISLSKGVETLAEPYPHLTTPTLVIAEEANIPLDRVFYFGGPNIAREIWQGEYATARLCGASPTGEALAEFLRSPSLIVWHHDDVITHEVLGGLKNVYALGMGIVGAATHDSATSKAVYFSNAAAEMVFIAQLLAITERDLLHGPLIADMYVTLLKGRNAWFGHQLGSGALRAADGDYVPGKGLIQGVSAVHAFHALFSDERLEIESEAKGTVRPVAMLPTLSALQRFLSHDGEVDAAVAEFMAAMKDQAAVDPGRTLKLLAPPSFHLLPACATEARQ